MSQSKAVVTKRAANKVDYNDIILIIDDRENDVKQFIESELYDIHTRVQRITVGDFALLYKGKIVAVFERKTYVDQAGSLKDGRHQNKQNLIDIHNKLHCSKFYIIEGPAFPSPNKTFGRKPYKDLESGIDHLMIRDGFQIIYTENPKHTAQRLNRFTKSMYRLCVNGETPRLMHDAKAFAKLKNNAENGNANKIENDMVNKIENENNELLESDDVNKIENDDNKQLVEGGDDINKTNTDEIALLQVKSDKPDIDVVREMWSCFKGISVISADMILQKYTMEQFVRGQLTQQVLNAMTYPSGRKISAPLKKSLSQNNKYMHIRILSKIPGISTQTARDILEQRELSALLTYPVEAISIIKIGKSKRKLGNKNAQNILKYFKWDFKKDFNK